MNYPKPSTLQRLALQMDCDIPYLPTDLTYHLRRAPSHPETSWGQQWSDKPHRLLYDACQHAEHITAAAKPFVDAAKAVIRNYGGDRPDYQGQTIVVPMSALKALIDAVEGEVK